VVWRGVEEDRGKHELTVGSNVAAVQARHLCHCSISLASCAHTLGGKITVSLRLVVIPLPVIQENQSSKLYLDQSVLSHKPLNPLFQRGICPFPQDV
jgi:hypothetical protein